MKFLTVIILILFICSLVFNFVLIQRLIEPEKGQDVERRAIITHFVPMICGYNILARIETNNYFSFKSKNHLLAHEFRDGKVVYTELSSSNFKDYIKDGNNQILDIINNLFSICNASTAEQKAEVIAEYIHRIPYEPDIDNYTKYPVETLAEWSGDCEDLSILAVTMASLAGVDAALVIFDNHVGIGFAFEKPIYSDANYYFEKDGKKYFYTELTGTQWPNEPVKWRIGILPSEYQNKDAFVLL